MTHLPFDTPCLECKYCLVGIMQDDTPTVYCNRPPKRKTPKGCPDAPDYSSVKTYTFTVNGETPRKAEIDSRGKSLKELAAIMAEIFFFDCGGVDMDWPILISIYSDGGFIGEELVSRQAEISFQVEEKE